MRIAQYILILFFSIQLLPFAVSNSITVPLTYEVDTPVEKPKPKAKKQKKQKKAVWKEVAQKQEKGLKKPGLAFWLAFAILTILVLVLGAFVIGLGLAPWSVTAFVMLGAEVASFLTLMMILWVDRPGGIMGPVFFFALLGLVAVNAIIGIAFIIWGLVFSWVWGWMLGLIMLGLAALFFLIHFLIAHFKNKPAKKAKENVG